MTRSIYVDPTAIVHSDAVLGDGAYVWNWSKVREGAHIGEMSSVGQCCYIDFDVVIGAGCKIQNGVSIYRGVTLGDRVFVGTNATFTNDRVPRAHNGDWTVAPTIVEEGVSIGANATIVCGVTLGAHCMIAAGAVVTSNMPPYALAIGCPARVVDYVTVSGARLHVAPGADAQDPEKLTG